MKTRSFLIAMIATIWLTACDGYDPNPTLTAEQQTLNAKIASWRQVNLSSYRYTYRKQCFCPPEESIVVIVVNSQVSQAFRTPSGVFLSAQELGNVFTIEGLFNKVQDAIDRRVYSLRVTYNATYHYPELIDIDGNQNLADDEISYSASNFQ